MFVPVLFLVMGGGSTAWYWACSAWTEADALCIRNWIRTDRVPRASVLRVEDHGYVGGVVVIVQGRAAPVSIRATQFTTAIHRRTASTDVERWRRAHGADRP